MQNTRYKGLATALLPLLLAACLPALSPERSGVVEGKALFKKERVAGALVTAAAVPGSGSGGATYSVESDEEGMFRLNVPPGIYYLTYRKEPGLFGFFGGNPVSVVPDQPSRVVLRGVRWAGRTEFPDSETSFIEGLARIDGEPASGAVVQVFLDASSHLRGPAYAMTRTDEDGRFSLDLPPGRYFLVARERRGEGRIGPLGVGDEYAYYPGNPIYLREGKKAVVDLPFLRVARDTKEALREAARGPRVSGRVTYGDGSPVRGVYACLYTGPEPMGMPAFVSGKTGEDGGFVVRVTGGGIYYLVARSAIGRPLEQGEYVAFYKGEAGHRILVETGKDTADLVILWEEN